MKIALIVLACVAGLVLILFLLAVFFVSGYFALPYRFTYEDSKKFLLKHNAYGSYDELKKEDYSIILRDGYKVSARFFPQKEKTDKYMIIVHGVTVNQVFDAKYTDLFYKLGFNLVTFSQRAHYDNKKTICTMGIKESLDLVDIINDTRNRYGKDIKLSLHGESLGASTVLMALKYTQDIDFAIADCPYMDLSLVAKREAKNHYHMPAFLVNVGGFVGRIFYGYNFTKIRPIDYIKESTVPLLFCHGKADNLIPSIHSEKMYEIYKGPKDIHLTEGADHAMSIVIDPIGYEEAVRNFINNLDKKAVK
ncbi:MAG: alpha/beta hydrolase [Bacillales bacterium]|nr:alpha/beta hydrolase [Bacillales bacterium]